MPHKHRASYLKISVRTTSIDALSDGSSYEPFVEDTFTALTGQTDLYKALTRRQREIARDLAKGYSRKEVAARKHISVQAIHQMVPRMRKRLRSYLEASHDRL